MTAPHLVLVASNGTDLCRASPSGVSGVKWCYDTQLCSIKTHTKADKMSIKPGLYVKSTGKGKLAFLEPHVPLNFVRGRGYAQQLLDLPISRSMEDWALIFQLINLHGGDFGSLSELEGKLLDLKVDVAAFKLQRSSRV